MKHNVGEAIFTLIYFMMFFGGVALAFSHWLLFLALWLIGVAVAILLLRNNFSREDAFRKAAWVFLVIFSWYTAAWLIRDLLQGRSPKTAQNA